MRLYRTSGRNLQEVARGGVVTQDEYDDVVRRVRQALMNACDPRTSEPLITAIHRTDQTPNVGGPQGADSYLEHLHS